MFHKLTIHQVFASGWRYLCLANLYRTIGISSTKKNYLISLYQQ